MEATKEKISGDKLYQEMKCDIDAVIVFGIIDGDIILFFSGTKKDYGDSIVITQMMITETKKLMKDGKNMLEYPSGKINYKLDFKGISKHLMEEGKEKLRKNLKLREMTKKKEEPDDKKGIDSGTT